jgi:hypothetical protein
VFYEIISTTKLLYKEKRKNTIYNIKKQPNRLMLNIKPPGYFSFNQVLDQAEKEDGY